MDGTVTQREEQRQANLIALHRQLQEMASRTKRPNPAPKDQSRDIQGPTMVIRGK